MTRVCCRREGCPDERNVLPLDPLKLHELPGAVAWAPGQPAQQPVFVVPLHVRPLIMLTVLESALVT